MGGEGGDSEVMQHGRPIPAQPAATAEQGTRSIGRRPRGTGNHPTRVAPRALAAPRQESHHDPIPHRDAGTVGAHGFDNPRCLVPQQHRHRADPVAVHHGQIRMTDACRLHSNQQLAIPGRVEEQVRDDEGAGLGIRPGAPDLLEDGTTDRDRTGHGFILSEPSKPNVGNDIVVAHIEFVLSWVSWAWGLPVGHTASTRWRCT